MSWNLTNDRPIYIQIIEQLQREILSGKYKSGEKFPTVRELATEAAVNPNTMQRALQELERCGLLITNRTTGRTITEDASLLSQMKDDLANKRIDIFEKEMKELGVSTDEILHYVEKKYKG